LKNFYDRSSGYIGALHANKLEIDHSLIYNGNISIESGREGTRHLLSLTNPPDAIFATEDFTALGVIKELKEKGIKIPEEFGVVGFANELFGEHITPTLSTVDQQTIGMGRSALNLLLAIIENRDIDHHIKQKIVLEPVLICRDSSNRTKMNK
jgi:LacI family transcriptional regulator